MHHLTKRIKLTAKAGDDLLDGTDNSELLSGLAGDTLNGGLGDDTLIGGTGDDLIVGGNGSDTVYFYIGDGHDTIDNQSTDTNSTTDTLIFGEGIAASDLRFIRHNNDADSTVLINGTSDTILVKNYFSHPEFYNNIKLQFADSTVITYAQLLHMGYVSQGDSLDNTLQGFWGDDTLIGAEGNDSLYGGLGNDTAIYTSSWLNATITANASTITVSSTLEGVDTLDGVETLVLNGVSIAAADAVNDAPIGVNDNNANDAVIEAGSNVVGDSSAVGNVLTNDTVQISH